MCPLSVAQHGHECLFNPWPFPWWEYPLHHSACRKWAILSPEHVSALTSHSITQEASKKRMSGPYPKEPYLNTFITDLPSAALKNSPGDSDVLISPFFFFSYKMVLTVSELPRTYLNTNIQITFSLFMSYIFYLNVVRFSSCTFNVILLYKVHQYGIFCYNFHRIMETSNTWYSTV